jgi:hypothetical protein
MAQMSLDEETYERLLQVAGLADTLLEQLEIILRLAESGELDSVRPELDDAARVVGHAQEVLRHRPRSTSSD